MIACGLRGRAEAQAAGRHAADRARLDGERDQVEDPLLPGHHGDALGDADSEVHDRVDLQQHRGAARDHLARVERRRDCVASDTTRTSPA